MIKLHFNELLKKKALLEDRKLPVRTVAQETGLSAATIQRLRREDPGRVYFSTLNTLCHYFGLSNISELIEFIPETDVS